VTDSPRTREDVAPFGKISSAGRWTLIEVLGSGGMGVVYRGEDPDGRIAAVKVLAAPLASDQMIRRFEREALARIDHPNVVHVLESGSTPDGTLYLALELLEGGDLQSKIDHGPLPPAEAVAIGSQIAAGLDAVHRLGIVHRDVKPGNVFVCNDGCAKILDFGIALQSSTDTRVTRMGTILGTPSYLSPEQARGEVAVDARSDVWSLGAVLYHALAGKPPFERDTALATIVAVLVDDLVKLTHIRPGVPRALAAVVERALEKDPDERWQTASDFAQALAAADLRAPAHTLDATMEFEPESLSEVRVVSVVLLEGVTDPARIAEVVRAHGGTVLPVVGGHAIGIFGGEVSEGNEPARAMRAAVAARGSAARVAVATGRAARSRGGVVGEAVSRAEAGCAQDRSGVVVDEGTRRSATAEYSFQSVSAGLYEIESMPARDTMVDPGSALAQGPPTLGRDAEIAQMRGALANALDGRAICILCLGPPGIGKSRLRREMTVLLAGATEPVRVLVGRAEPHAAGASVIVEAAVSGLGGWVSGAPIEERRAALLALCEEMVGDPLRGLECAEALGETIGTPFPESPRMSAARADPQLMSDRLRMSFAELVAGICERGTVAFVLEDLHWIDALSLDLLDEVLDRLSDQKLVVFATARPELFDQRPNLFAGREVVRMEPRGLGLADVTKLAQAVAKRSLPDDLCRALFERTAGNPFFVEQIVLDLREHGDLDLGIEEVPLPLTVEAAVQSRLDHLRPDEKEICKRSAVYGRTFWEEALAIVGITETRRPLQALQKREIVASRARSRFRGLREYQFRSAVLAEVGYRMLPTDVRAELHKAAAAFLEARDEASPEEIALHLERAGMHAEAAERYTRAAHAAAGRGETDALLRCSERALALGPSDDARFGLHLARADAYRLLGRSDDRTQDLAAALDAARGDADKARALSLQAQDLSRAGNTDAALDTARAAVAAARSAADSDALTAARSSQAVLLVLAGRMTEAGEAVAEAALAAEKGATVLNRAAAAWARATVAALAGDLGASRDAYQQTLALCREAGDVRRMAAAEANLADCYNRIGLHADAEAALRAALEACRRVRNRKTEGYVLANLAHSLSETARHEEALDTLSEAGRVAAEVRDARLVAMIGIYRSMALLGRGDTLDAAILADDTAASARTQGLQGYAARALAVSATAHLALGISDAALSRSTVALSLRDELGGLEENEGAVFVAHAEALRRSGRADEAKAVLRRGRERLEELASRISDPVWRDRFLRGPGGHRQLMEG